MSGTSLDGVDGVLADFSGERMRVLAHQAAPFPDALRAEFLALNASGSDEIHRGALAANGLARLYGSVVGKLLQETGLPPSAVRAVGAHGQTVRHRPGEFDGTGYTTQLNQPALVGRAVRRGRSGGLSQSGCRSRRTRRSTGTTFSPGVLQPHGERLAVLNIGGISNLTLLHAQRGEPRAGIRLRPGQCIDGRLVSPPHRTALRRWWSLGSLRHRVARLAGPHVGRALSGSPAAQEHRT